MVESICTRVSRDTLLCRSLLWEVYTSSDRDRGRSNANAVIWKPSDNTTIPVTLGPTSHQTLRGEEKGASSNCRRNCIGDLSGRVRITNVGTVRLWVKCHKLN